MELLKYLQSPTSIPQTFVNIPITKRSVIQPPQTTTAAGQTDPGTWDPSTSVTVKPGPRPAPATHQAVRPQGLRTMPDPQPKPGGPEYPQGILGPYPQHHPHHYQRHHQQRPHDNRHQHHPHHYHCPAPCPTRATTPRAGATAAYGMAATGRSTSIPRLPPGATTPRTRNRIPSATMSTPKGPPRPNSTRDSHATRTTSRHRRRTPARRINGGQGTFPPLPGTRRHDARPPRTR